MVQRRHFSFIPSAQVPSNAPLELTYPEIVQKRLRPLRADEPANSVSNFTPIPTGSVAKDFLRLADFPIISTHPSTGCFRAVSHDQLGHKQRIEIAEILPQICLAE